MTLSDTIATVHSELSHIIPESDLVIPGGSRAMAAAYVHVQLPMLQAGVEGYGFQDSALTDTQKAFSTLSDKDRRQWIHAVHKGALMEAQWFKPQLSRCAYEWLHHEGREGGLLDQAIRHLPGPDAVRSMPYDGEKLRDHVTSQ